MVNTTEKESPVQESLDFYCTLVWHFSRMGKYESLIYNHAHQLTSKTPTNRRYYPAIAKLAVYFGTGQKTIRRAVHNLEKQGFFFKLREERGKPIVYRPIEHKEWKGRFPGRCLDKIEMPWVAEIKDPLVGRLHAASDGRLKLYTNFVRGLRNTGHSDDAIVNHWQAFYELEHGKSIKGIYRRFMVHLRAQPVTFSV